MARIITNYGGLLLAAMGQTLLLALCGLFFACILGLVFGILSVLKNRACNIIATVFVDIIRGVPMIVLAFYVYFAVPMLLNNILHLNTMLGMKGQITFSALQAGTICLALNCGAYMAEIIRAGIESVDKGQMEAARSLGLSYWKAMAKVVLPQAIRTMIPSIINQFIITLKDTSILSVIGFIVMFGGVVFAITGSRSAGPADKAAPAGPTRSAKRGKSAGGGSFTSRMEDRFRRRFDE